MSSVDMKFDVLWRSSAGDQPIVSFTHHYDVPSMNAFYAVPFDGDAMGQAVPASAGDLLVLRFTATASSSTGPAFIVNGDGPNSNGRIPALTLPP